MSQFMRRSITFLATWKVPKRFRWSIFAPLLIGLLICMTTPPHAEAAPQRGRAAAPRIAGGVNHTMVIKSDGTLWAWGDNQFNQLGDGTTRDKGAPMRVGADFGWVSVSGYNHTLAIKSNGTLWGWGMNTLYQLGLGGSGAVTMPFQIGTDTKWVSVAAGRNHSVAVKSDGTLWAWGYNTNGQVGNNSTTAQVTPVQIGTDTKWVSVAAGYAHTVAVKADGTLWTWGYNNNGQLGLGDTTQRLVPVQVGADTKWISVAAGQYSTMALKSDGTLWAWGSNANGQLGCGVTNICTGYANDYSPIQIGTDTNWVSIEMGYSHTVATKSNGTLWAWGYNNYGQLGQGDTTQRTAPTQIGTETEWVSVAAGDYHTIAVKSDGTLMVWGYNTAGQIGDGTNTNRNAPVAIDTRAGKWSSLLASGFSTAAIESNGTLWTWGRNANGQLGDRTVIDRTLPVKAGLDNKWVSLGGGTNHLAAVRSDGTLWAWGYNGYGQLGQGDATQRLTPTKIGTDTKWVSVTGGMYHTVAVKSDGTLWAWGYNYYGQLGDNSTTTKYAPVQVGTDTKWVAVAAGQYYTVAVKSDGTLWAWGANDSGQLGLGSSDTNTHPTPVQIGTDTKWVSVAAGYYYAIAIKSDGTLWAWGQNTYGQLGLGDTTQRTSPVQVTGSDWVSVEAGTYQTAALKSNGTLWAWGYNNLGQLGLGSSDTSAHPTPVQIGTDTDWVRITAGNYHTGALKSDGTLWFWGSNQYGQLGDGAFLANENAPSQLLSGDKWLSVTSGTGHSAGLKRDKTLWAWGYNNTGQVGDGTMNNRTVPTQIGADIWDSVAVGDTFTEATKSNGTLWAWGSNDSGQLGDGTLFDRLAPQQIGADTWAMTSEGTLHTVALKPDGTLWVWGEGSNYRLGLGDTVDRSTPTQVGTSTWVSVAAGYQNTVAIRSDGTLWAWGDNTYGQIGCGASCLSLSTPQQIGTDADWFTVAAGYYYTVAIKTNGTLWAWGWNSSGQLGCGASCLSTNAPQQIGSDTSWVSVSARGTHTVGLQKPPASGWTLYAWGYNLNGQLGVGDTTNRSTPTVVGTDFIAASAGTSHTLAVKRDGTLWSWGDNFYGELGLGTIGGTTSKNTPQQVIGSLTVMTTGYGTGDISGNGLTCSNGTCSGPFEFGTEVVITATPTGSSSFVGWFNCPNAAENVCTVTVSSVSSTITAMFNDASVPTGTVSVTHASDDYYGAAWYTKYPNMNLVLNASDPAGVSQMQFSNNNSAWSNPEPYGQNKVWDMTENAYGGNTSDGAKFVYVRFKDNAGNWSTATISAGVVLDRTSPTTGTFSIAGAPRTNKTTVDLSTYATDNLLWATQMQFSNNGTDWSSLVPYQLYYYAWPLSAGDGQKTVYVRYTDPLGNLSSYVTATITLDTAPSSGTVSINNGAQFVTSPTVTVDLVCNDVTSACSQMTLSSDGITWGAVEPFVNQKTNYALADGPSTAWAWGSNIFGQIGIGVTGTQQVSPLQSGSDDQWIALASGAYHKLALRSDGTLWTWGKNQFGQLGIGSYTDQYAPRQVGTDSDWVMVAAGSYHSFAVKANGSLWTWGRNTNGQLGDGSTIDKPSPVQISGVGRPVAIAAGDAHSVIIVDDGTPYNQRTLYTWGSNAYGQLGLGNTTQQTSPAWAASGSSGWAAISAGNDHTIAVKTDGTLWVWGRNNYCQLGLGPSIICNDVTGFRTSPVQLDTATDWSGVATGAWHSLAFKTSGSLSAWGFNTGGQLGIGNTTNQNVPQPVSGGGAWKAVSGGGSHSLGIRTDGTLWAWGFNSSGQVGNGNTTQQNVPQQISDGTIWRTVSAGFDSSSAIPVAATKYVFAKFHDEAGNWSQIFSDSIVLDTSAPTGSVSINGGAIYATNNYVDLNIVCSDPVSGCSRMCVSSTTSCSAWEDYSAVKSGWNLGLVEGIKTVYVWIKDTSGNTTAAETPYTDTILLDFSAPAQPVVNGTTPTNSKRPTWTWTHDATGGNGTFQYKLDTGVYTSTTSTSYAPSFDLAEGPHTLYVQERDDAGTWSLVPGSLTITVDFTAPAAPTVSGTSPTNNKRPTWSWTHDAAGGSGTYQYKLDTNPTYTTTTSTSFAPGADLANGNHMLFVQERDAAGNWSLDGSYTITVDITPPNAPTVTGTSPTNSKRPTWSWTHDAAGGNGMYQYKLDTGIFTATTATSYTPGADLGNGDHTFLVEERDAVGNWSLDGSYRITVDITPPNAPTVTGVSPTNNKRPTWSWTHDAAGGNGTYQYKLDTGVYTSTTSTSFASGSDLGNGDHTLLVQERDAVGNWSLDGSSTITVDITPPTAPTVTGVSPTNNKRPTWSWTHDAAGGSGTYQYKLDTGIYTSTTATIYAPASDLSDGPHTLSVQERDAVGNWSTDGNFTITVDITPPNAPTVTGTSPTNNKRPTWSWTHDGAGGNGTYQYKLDTGIFTSTTATSYTPGADLGNGDHTLLVEERDAVGNWSLDGSFKITIDIIAPNAPTVTGASPTNNKRPTWSWTHDAAGGSGTYQYKLDSGVYTSTTSTSYAPAVDLGEGSHILYVQEKDAVGNWSVDGSSSITVDITAPAAPTVTGVSPTNSKRPTWNWTHDATGGNGTYQYKLDDSNLATGATTTVSLAYAPAANLSDGIHTLYVQERDTAGNWSLSGSFAALVDAVAPTGSITIIDNLATYATSTSVQLTLTCIDATSGCATMEFKNETDTWSSPEAFNATKDWTLSTTNGTKTVNVRFTDAAGTTSTYSDTIILDDTAPVTEATPGGGTKTGAIGVHLSCSDASTVACGPTYYTTNGSPPDTTSTLYTGSTITISGVQSPVDLKFFSIDHLGKAETPKTVTYEFLASYTELTLDLASPTLPQNGLLDASGKLTGFPNTEALPNNGMDLSGLTVTLTITGPAGSACASGCQRSTTTYTSLGHYEFKGLNDFEYTGLYTIRASFGATGLHQASQSSTESLLVGSSAGYAIIVEGKVSNSEGLLSHNKTANRVYDTLKERGFEDDNIFYFNYGGTMIPGVNAATDKAGIEYAITTWARDRMNGSPAPLYIIMVDHGNRDTFYIDPDTITPAELDDWLKQLELGPNLDGVNGLNTQALLEKRVVVMGACYSGSFVSALSSGPTTTNGGRIVITSATADEPSYKGPNEPLESGETESIRSGEFFLDEFFKEIKKGSSVKASFIAATERTESYTSQGSSVSNVINGYGDNAVQHPLLDDNGDTIGSNVLSDGGDGASAADLYVGFGNTNATLGPADIKAVTPTQALLASDSQVHQLYAEAYSNAAVSSAWFEMKSPSKDLTTGPSTGTFQRTVDILKTSMTLTTGGRWQAAATFTEAGTYEIFYFTKSTNSEISEMKRSVVYKDWTGNHQPNAFDLVSPTPTDPHPHTELFLSWNETTDPDDDRLTYTVQIAADDQFTTLKYQKEELGTSIYAVGAEAGLEDQTTYYWRVIAVDQYGSRLTSNQTWTFHTDNRENQTCDTSTHPAKTVTVTVTDGSTGSGTCESGTVVYQAAVVVKEGTTQIGSGTTNSSGLKSFTLCANNTFTIDITKAGYYYDSLNNAITVSTVSNLKCIQLNPIQYTLTLAKAGTGSGTVAANGAITSSKPFNTGTVVTLSATPSTGSDFTSWTGDADCSDWSVTLTASKTCTATFTLKKYTVSASVSGGNGSVTPSSRLVSYGSTTTFSITPNTGYHISSVSGCGGSLNGNTYTTGAITGVCSVTASFTNAAPTVPSLASPADQAEVTTLTPSLSALATDADGDPINYLYEVSSTSDFGTIVAQSSGVSGSWPVSPALSDNTTYWWRARATDGTAISSNMSAASFFVNMANDAPTAPSVSAPTNGGTISTLTPVLSVTNASDLDNDALTYDFHVSLASNYTTTVSLVTGLSTTSWITGTLLDNMHYYWRSRAVDSHGLAGPWSTASFFVNTGNEAPSVPALSSPANGVEVASQTPVLTINPSIDPEGDSITYFYELDTVSSFDSGNKRTATTSATSWTPSPLADNTTWYWRVRASDGTADSSWMTASFFVNAANDAPTAPTVNYPADGSTVTVRTPQLSVNAAADPDHDSLTYQYEVYSDSGLTHLVAIEQGAGPSWTMSTVLTDNTWYYWHARAQDEHNAAGNWTAATSFFVNNSGTNDPPTISVLSPGASDAVAYGTSHTIRWSDSDPDSDATITLGYDTVASGCTGTVIAASISENDPANQYAWNIAALAYNTNYWVYAKIDDGTTQSCAYASNALIRIDPATLALTVTKAGAGTVVSSPSGIDCGSDCSEVFATITPVTLTATPAASTTFTGWSGGGCSGTGVCQTTIDQAKTVTATFVLKTYTVSAVTDQNGGLDPGTPSPALVSHGTGTTFIFKANAGYHLASIDGTCGTAYTPATNTEMTHAYLTGAVTGDCTIFGVFAPDQYVLTVVKSGTGSGSVTSSPAGIACGSDCSEASGYNSQITLSASAQAGSTFSGWSGAGCTGTGNCVVTLNGAKSVIAQFQFNTAAVSEVTLGANLLSPQVTGTSVVFTAQGTGGSGAYEYQFLIKAEGDLAWTTTRAYAAANTWTWATAGVTPGAYTVMVYVRNQGSSSAFDMARTRNFSVVAVSPAQAGSFLASRPSPLMIGPLVTFTAKGSGGTGSYEYKFLRKLSSSTTWTTLREYGAGTWTWDTAAAVPGTYTLLVYIRNQGSPATYEAMMTMSYSVVTAAPATGTTLSVNMPSPVVSGSTVTFTAQGSGGSGTYDYQFLRKYPSSEAWETVQDYSGTNTWSWDTHGGIGGTYTIKVNVKSHGSAALYEVVRTMNYTVTLGAPATGATLTSSPVSTVVSGLTVTLTATGIGGTGTYDYQFLRKDPSSSTWTVARDYAPDNTFAWNTTGVLAGTYTLKVYVRNLGSLAVFEAARSLTYTVLDSPATGATLTANPANSVISGPTVTFTAQAIGGTGTYEYQFLRKDPSSSIWDVVQDYAEKNTWAWGTSGATVGTYTVKVFVRHPGSPLAYEVAKSMPYTIK